MLDRAESVLDLVNDVIKDCRDKSVANTELLEVIAAQYVAVVAYADIERELGDMIEKRLKRIGDEKVSYFIYKLNEKMFKRVPKTDIAETAACFGDNCRADLNNRITEKDVQSYTNLIQTRHDVAHPGTSNATMAGVRDGLEAGKRILSEFVVTIE